MQADVYNLKNEIVGTAELSPRVFKAPWRSALVAQVVRALDANSRRPWASTKGRGEVSGGGKKPWRQKGTGRARHGSIRSPIWKGGGVTHGPQSERAYTQKVNKKMRQAALFSALSKKLKDKEIKIFDALEFEAPKTKLVAAALRTVLDMKPSEKQFSVVLVPDTNAKATFRAAANLPKVDIVDPRSLNVRDVLKFHNLFIDRRAIAIIESHYASAKNSSEKGSPVSPPTSIL